MTPQPAATPAPQQQPRPEDAEDVLIRRLAARGWRVKRTTSGVDDTGTLWVRVTVRQIRGEGEGQVIERTRVEALVACLRVVPDASQ